MPRPKIEHGAKTKHIDVRVSPEEQQSITQAANEAGMFVADFVRSKVIGAIPRTRKATPEREAFLKGMAELGKIGSNINQIAHALNTHKDSPLASGVSSDLITNSLHGIEMLSHHLLTKLQDGH